ncbi:MAG: hypothetical protein FGM24_08685 [Candidatus Kapabacteria bacterium]|nr:hypothetical protein [Candidatus Kapabacteria bacterium]
MLYCTRPISLRSVYQGVDVRAVGMFCNEGNTSMRCSMQVMRNSYAVRALITLFVVAMSATLHAQQWKVLGKMSTARRWHQISLMNTDEVLVAGGQGPTSSCEIINVRTGAIRTTTSMTVPRAYFAMLKTPDGNVVALGGWKSGRYDILESVESYNPSTETWTVIGSFLQPRFQHSATMIDDHRILIVGGRDENAGALAHCEIFDLRTGNSKRVADFPFSTSQHRAVRLGNGQVVVLGGRSGGPGSYRSRFAYVYDEVKNTWNEYAELPFSAFYPAVALDSDGSIIVAGGSEREFSDGTFTASSQVVVMSERVPSRTLDDRLFADKVPQGIVRLSDGRKLVIGGWLGSIRATSTCEFINIENTEIESAPMMRVARGESECVALTDGLSTSSTIVLSIGGIDSSLATSNIVEILRIGCEGGSTSLLQASKHVVVEQATGTPTGIRLTPAESFSRGAAWASQKADLTKPFTMLVGFRMRSGSDNGDLEDVPSAPGADGIALVIQNEGPQAVGQYGRGIGYDGIKRSIAVEFDTYHNPPVNDPNGNHIGIQSLGRAANSSKHMPPANLGFTSNILPMRADSTVYYAYLEYDNKQLRVYFNDRPSFRSPALVRDIDLDSLIGLDSAGMAWVGITSATGRSVEEHEIVRWEINACPGESPVSVDTDRKTSRDNDAPCNLIGDRLIRNDVEAAVIEVVDVQGRVLWALSTSRAEVALPVDLFASGRYLVSVRTSANVCTVPWLLVR